MVEQIRITRGKPSGRAPPNESVSSKREFFVELARGAGSIIKHDFYLPKTAETKSDGSPVTKTDKRINQIVITEVRRRYPEYNILSEESNPLNQQSIYTVVCDPLDGTGNFLKGIPNCCFSIAFEINGRPFISVQYDPFTDRMLYAEMGNGSFLNGKTVKLSTDKNLKGSTVGLDLWKGMQFDLNNLKYYLEENGTKLTNGPMVFMGIELACGNISAFVHPARMPYESAASVLITEEAEGMSNDMFGNNQRYDGRIKGCVVSNGLVHNELMGFVRKHVKFPYKP
jgi:fructose-1,6-bisphosphatase/inositol monophosphatase family enzyme